MYIFAANVRVVQDFNGDGDNLIFYELVSGPLTTYTRDVPNPLESNYKCKISSVKMQSLTLDISGFSQIQRYMTK